MDTHTIKGKYTKKIRKEVGSLGVRMETPEQGIEWSRLEIWLWDQVLQDSKFFGVSLGGEVEIKVSFAL